jgi:hypothetical protein
MKPSASSDFLPQPENEKPAGVVGGGDDDSGRPGGLFNRGDVSVRGETGLFARSRGDGLAYGTMVPELSRYRHDAMTGTA